MKRMVSLILAALLFAVPAFAAAEERTVATAIAAEVNPDALVSVAVDALITDCDGGAVTVTLLVPERYRADEILSLKEGDAIFTQGREVEIRSVSEEDGYLVFNAGEEDEVYLFQSFDMDYWIQDVNDHTWTELATLSVPLPEDLIFLDDVDPVSGVTLITPSVHSKAELLAMLEPGEDEIGFDRHNVLIVFNEKGELAVIRRYYTPWE